MIAAVTRLVLLAHIAIALPAVAAVVVPGAAIRPSVALLAGVLFGASLGMGAIELRRVERPTRPEVPSAAVAIAHLVVLTTAVAVMSAAIGAPGSWFTVVLLVPVILAAFIGRPGFAATVFAAGVIGFAVSSAATGTYAGALLGATVGFALATAGVVLMISLVSTSMIKSHGNLLNLVNAGATAARADSIETGLAELAALIRTTHAGGTVPSRVDVYRVGAGSAQRLEPETAVWQPAHRVPDGVLIDRAIEAGGVATEPDRALLVSEAADSGRIVIEIELAVPTNLEHHAIRFDLDRYALHLGLLVERLAALDELSRLGQTDGLTGLPNRRALVARLEQESATIAAGGAGPVGAAALSLVMIDLDDFKAYNDRFGHPEGDRLLVDVASMLQQRIRARDLVARYGGEEFCLVLPSTDEAGARRLLDELHTWAALLRPDEAITFSAGIAIWDGTDAISTALSRADQALYCAKAEGKDRTVLASSIPED